MFEISSIFLDQADTSLNIILEDAIRFLDVNQETTTLPRWSEEWTTLIRKLNHVLKSSVIAWKKKNATTIDLYDVALQAAEEYISKGLIGTV